jgi:hypothetical protein
VTLGLKQPADLAIAPLGQFDHEMRFTLRSLAHRHRVRAQVANPCLHTPRRNLVDKAAGGDDVPPDDCRLWRRQPVRELRVGGEQEKSRARLVETSNRYQ